MKLATPNNQTRKMYQRGKTSMTLKTTPTDATSEVVCRQNGTPKTQPHADKTVADFVILKQYTNDTKSKAYG